MFIETIALLAVIVFLFYKWTIPKSNYFIGRNVKYDKYIPLLGSMKGVFLRTKSINDVIIDLYKKFEGEQ